MNIIIIANSDKNGAKMCAQNASDFLKKLKVNTEIFPYEYNQETCKYRKKIDESDIVIAVGGDGTIIHTATLCAEYAKPILGINAGKLGFTAGMEIDELPLLENLVLGDYVTEKRCMIKVSIKNSAGSFQKFALNDAVISGELSKIVQYNMAISGKKRYTYRADGFILSTPTGSTAYSLSAGGPVVEPTMNAMLYTPICPHSLLNRSVVFDKNTRLEVSVGENLGKIYLTVDGESPLSIEKEASIDFSIADVSADLIRLNERSFYDTLNEKIIRSVF